MAGLAAVVGGLTPGSPGTPAARAATAGAAARLVSHQSPLAAAAAISAAEWPSYLNGPGHTSYSPTLTAISPGNAVKLTQRWDYTAGAPYLASPAVADNSIFIGSATGWFYKINEFTGALEAQVYMGISSSCDQPLVRGGVIAFSQSTGRKTGEFFTVPAGAGNAGGSVWSSIGIGPNGDVYATSGNGPADKQRLAASEDVIRLRPRTLQLLAAFKVPQKQVTTDGDFGASPVFFDGMVGACNKNGIFYALNQTTMKMVWWKRIANASGGTGECLVAPAYNGTDLFFGGGKTTVNGTAYAGSVQERLATTGAVQWTTGMPGSILGSPTLDGAGLLTASIYGGTAGGVYLFSAATGQQIEELVSGGDFGQAVFANGRIFCTNASGVTAWAVS